MDTANTRAQHPLLCGADVGIVAVGKNAIGGVNAMGLVAIGGVNAVGVVAIAGFNATGVIAIGGGKSNSALPCPDRSRSEIREGADIGPTPSNSLAPIHRRRVCSGVWRRQ